MNKSYTIVIAEDEELLLKNLETKIYGLNLSVHVCGRAQTGEQALEQIRLHSPDILITDIRMPVMDGMKLLSIVSETYPLLKTIILSGYSDFDYAKEAISYNVENYILKPVDEDELREVLYKITAQLEIENGSRSSEFPIPQYSTKEEAAEALKEYIRAHYKENLNLDLFISCMNYSHDYIKKCFSQIYGFSPVQYMISLRIHEAQHLLIHYPELSIQNIGEIVGYTELSYFSRIFKKYAGQSPGAYRDLERRRITMSEELLFPGYQQSS